MGMVGRLVAAVALLLLLAAIGGCGSDSSSSGEEQEEAFYPWVKGPSREFLVPDGDNLVQTFGREASKAEREQASRVITEWMKARAAKDWKKDCSYFSRKYIHSLVAEDATKVSGGKVATCPQALAYFGPQASGDYKNTLAGPIDSLRVRESQAYAQYHGRDGKDWIVPMEKEGGKWWVSTAAPIDRNK